MHLDERNLSRVLLTGAPIKSGFPNINIDSKLEENHRIWHKTICGINQIAKMEHISLLLDDTPNTYVLEILPLFHAMKLSHGEREFYGKIYGCFFFWEACLDDFIEDELKYLKHIKIGRPDHSANSSITMLEYLLKKYLVTLVERRNLDKKTKELFLSEINDFFSQVAKMFFVQHSHERNKEKDEWYTLNIYLGFLYEKIVKMICCEQQRSDSKELRKVAYQLGMMRRAVDDIEDLTSDKRKGQDNFMIWIEKNTSKNPPEVWLRNYQSEKRDLMSNLLKTNIGEEYFDLLVFQPWIYACLIANKLPSRLTNPTHRVFKPKVHDIIVE